MLNTTKIGWTKKEHWNDDCNSASHIEGKNMTLVHYENGLMQENVTVINEQECLPRSREMEFCTKNSVSLLT